MNSSPRLLPRSLKYSAKIVSLSVPSIRDRQGNKQPHSMAPRGAKKRLRAKNKHQSQNKTKHTKFLTSRKVIKKYYVLPYRDRLRLIRSIPALEKQQKEPCAPIPCGSCSSICLCLGLSLLTKGYLDTLLVVLDLTNIRERSTRQQRVTRR